MPVSREQAERALRAAHAAGDVEAARSIAKGIKDQGLLDARPGPSTGERVARFAGGTLGAVAGAPAGLPGMITGGSIGAPAAGEAYRFAESQPELREPMSWTEMLFPVPAAVNRLGQAITSDEVVPGSPPPRTTGEVVEDVGEAAIEGGFGGALGYGGRAVLGMGDDALRSAGRGLRTRPGAQIAANEQRAAQAAAGVKDDRGTISTLLAELGKTAGFGGAVGMIDGGLTAAGGAVVGAMLRLPAATRALLANNPRFAQWALGSGPTAASTATAAAGGQAAVQTGTFTADQVDQLMQMMVDEGPDVAAGLRQLMREAQALAREQMQ